MSVPEQIDGAVEVPLFPEAADRVLHRPKERQHIDPLGYARHDAGCVFWGRRMMKNPTPCTCGLDGLLKEIEG